MGYNPPQTPSDEESNGSASGKPMLLDLDGDGIEIMQLSSSNIFLDVLNDGLKHRTAWAGVGDGVLVRDAGNDGVIKFAHEIDFTQWDSSAKSDLEALRNAFDSNQDGKLTAADADWSLFKVMVTKADGTTELKTLAQLGIAGLNLITNNQEVVYADGSKILGTADYTRADGTTGKLGDAMLKFDLDGYLITETSSTSGNATTIVTLAHDTAGNLQKKTVATTDSVAQTRDLSFDDNGDGIVDRVIQITGYGTANELVRYFGPGAVLLSGEQTQIVGKHARYQPH